MAKPVLQIIIGSTRPGRVGSAVADWIIDRARARGDFEVEVADRGPGVDPKNAERSSTSRTTRGCAGTPTSTPRTGARSSTGPTRSFS